MKIIRVLIICLVVLASCREQESEKITIAAAANMQFAIDSLVTDFTDRTGIPCDLVISSSGKLTAQIMEGAPYDILLAANMKYPDYIYSNGKSSGPPQVYAYGKLVLWSLHPNTELSLEVLADSTVEKIALPNPKTAPYGEAAIKLLRKKGLLDSVSHKFVYGESIAQTNQFITTEAVALGFTSLSVVLSEPMKNIGRWVVLPEREYDPIKQGAVLIEHDNGQNQLSEKFFDYLLSAEAGKILEEFGYSRSE